MSKHLLPGLGSLLGVLVLFSATGVAGPGNGNGKPGGGGGSEPPPAPEITYVADGDLMVMNADGTNQRVVLAGSDNVANSVHGIGNPDWSPSGDRIVFGATIDDQRGIYVIGADGTGLRLIVGGRASVPVWSPGPIPGGTTVIAYLDQAAGETQNDIYLVDPDAATPIPERLTDTPEWFESGVTWSPSGTKLAVKIGIIGDSDSQDVWALYDFFTDTYVLHRHAGPLAGASVYQPAWSKTDETLIAWSVARPVGELSDIWIVDLDDPAGAWNLTATDTVGERRPTWSPDDSRIAYMANHAGPGKKTVQGIERIDANGTHVMSLSGGGFPSWRR